jgi:hypothetical protein
MCDDNRLGLAQLAGRDGRQGTNRDEVNAHASDVDVRRPGLGLAGIWEAEQPVGQVDDNQIGELLAVVLGVVRDLLDTFG